MIVAVAAWLRLADLADRPMHADEANQAVKLGHLLEGGEYRFDPRDHHGPTLYYLGLIPAWIRGQGTLADLDETTVRLTPACAGILGVLFLGLLLGRVSLAAGWSAAALMAVSPLAVYYSRYFVQETLLSTFFLLGLYAFVRWRQAGTWGWAIAAGGAVGLGREAGRQRVGAGRHEARAGPAGRPAPGRARSRGRGSPGDTPIDSSRPDAAVRLHSQARGQGCGQMV